MTSVAETHLKDGNTPSDQLMRSVTGFVKGDGDNKSLNLLVDGVHCATCISRIESRLLQDPTVTTARLNLTLRRLSVEWRGDRQHADRIAAAVEALGFQVAPFDPEHLARSDDDGGRELLRALAIAAFASSNVMMLSLAVWIGQAQDMAVANQHLFQWLAALLTLPAVAFAGRPFFRSALRALRGGRTNIDVPIALGLILTTAISTVELVRQGQDVYFDSAATLLFVLLIGRYLDFRVKARSRGAVERLLMLKAHGATLCLPDGRTKVVPAEAVEPDMIILVRSGERVPVDGLVVEGRSALDVAIVTGESMPFSVVPGNKVLAGSINGASPLRIRAVETVERSHLAEIVRLVEQAELRKGPIVTLADRVARAWTPLVHGVALLTLLGWWLMTDVGFSSALLHAVSVLIIACPCAIGLAVPAVQVVATGSLLRRGILLRSGDAIERLASIDHVAFDKTGTLTEGRPRITVWPDDKEAIQMAASLAAASSHPAAKAIRVAHPFAFPPVGTVEHPGEGVSFVGPDGELRLGRASFCSVDAIGQDNNSEIWLVGPGRAPARFAFDDPLREDASVVTAAFRRKGVTVSILSGDRMSAVQRIATVLGVSDWRAGLLPGEKLQVLDQLGQGGRRVLMVGDGLNDAPALAAAHISASFTHGAPASQSAADIVLPGDRLSALVTSWLLSRRALGIIKQNLAMAAVYNIALIPVAMLGLVTPLGAAVAMAASSLTVTLNALRAGGPPRLWRA